MESIIRNVSDIEPNPRHWLEASLGQHLDDSQRVMIMVLNVGKEPDAAIRQAASYELRRIRAEASANIEAKGAAAAEVDTIVDEAVADIRHRLR